MHVCFSSLANLLVQNHDDEMISGNFDYIFYWLTLREIWLFTNDANVSQIIAPIHRIDRI